MGPAPSVQRDSRRNHRPSQFATHEGCRVDVVRFERSFGALVLVLRAVAREVDCFSIGLPVSGALVRIPSYSGGASSPRAAVDLLIPHGPSVARLAEARSALEGSRHNSARFAPNSTLKRRKRS
jgi:hypothetical protein